jgi:hypothetical protein
VIREGTLVSDCGVVAGTCTAVPEVRLVEGGRGYEATVRALDGKTFATIDHTRRLLIHEV